VEITTNAEERAQFLLERMRDTPMRRGGLSRRLRQLKLEISRALAAEGVPPALARRVGLQLAVKFHRRDLHDEAEWRAIGQILHREVVCLQEQIGMSAQRIVVTLPKLSAAQVVEFLGELTSTDRRIARTILHAAVSTSDPLGTGRRYLAEYRLVVRTLRAIDPTMARTVAAATFSAGAPLSKALEHLRRFSSLLAKYQDDPRMARRLARAGFRARPVAREIAR
jgi:hypothetical protein